MLRIDLRYSARTKIQIGIVSENLMRKHENSRLLLRLLLFIIPLQLLKSRGGLITERFFLDALGKRYKRSENISRFLLLRNIGKHKV